MGLHTVTAVTAHYHHSKNHNDMRVLTAIAALANDATSIALIKTAELKPATGLHTNTLSATIKRLISQGVLTSAESQDAKDRKCTAYIITLTCNTKCAVTTGVWHDGTITEETEQKPAPKPVPAPVTPPAEPSPATGETRRKPLSPHEYLAAPEKGQWKPETPLVARLKQAATRAAYDAWAQCYPGLPQPKNLIGRIQKHVDSLWRAHPENTVETAERIIDNLMNAVCLVREYGSSNLEATGANPTPPQIVNYVLDATELLFTGTAKAEVKEASRYYGLNGSYNLSAAIADMRRERTARPNRPAGILETTAKMLSAQKQAQNPVEGAWQLESGEDR